MPRKGIADSAPADVARSPIRKLELRPQHALKIHPNGFTTNARFTVHRFSKT
jgi:hypothetical protein